MRWSENVFIVWPNAKWAAPLFAVCIVAPLLGGCDQIDKYITDVVGRTAAQKSENEHKEIVDLRREISNLKSQQAALEADTSKLRQDLEATNFSQSLMRLDIDAAWQSTVQISEGGSYGLARTAHGPVIVSMDKIEPYLDGYKVTLSVGNPTTVTFSDATIEVEWGLPWGNGRSYVETSKSRKKKTFSILKSFQPGAYTLTEVALTPAKAEEIKSLSVGVTWSKINMRRAP
jgi:hypothetical protein